MSFFMNNAANQSVNMQNMAMAEQELEMVSDLFNRYADRYLHYCHCSLHVPLLPLLPCRARELWSPSYTPGDIDADIHEETLADIWINWILDTGDWTYQLQTTNTLSLFSLFILSTPLPLLTDRLLLLPCLS